MIETETIAGSFKQLFKYDIFLHAMAGMIGSIISVCIFYPLQIVTFWLQVNDHQKATGTFQLIHLIFKKQGLYALYCGLSSVIQCVCVSDFIYFYIFYWLKIIGRINEKNTNDDYLIKDVFYGCVAGVINVLITTPLWVVYCRLQQKEINSLKKLNEKSININNNSTEYSGMLDGLYFVWLHEGVNGLWAGLSSSILLVCNPAIQFMMYEFFKRHFLINDDAVGGGGGGGIIPANTYSYFLIGALAKMFATVVTYPMQLVQTKLRQEKKQLIKKNDDDDDKNDGDDNNSSTISSSRNDGVIYVLMCVINASGFGGLFRGMEAKLLQTVFHAALKFACYENLFKLFYQLAT